MAPRSPRQIIKDRLDGAVKDCEWAILKLQEVGEMYMDTGNPDYCPDLLMFIDSLGTVGDAIERFRKERA